MTDTQEAMREFGQWFEENFEPHDRATTYGYSALEECWQAATAQSAEKMARLEAEMGPLRVADEVNSSLWDEINEAKEKSGYNAYWEIAKLRGGGFKFSAYLRQMFNECADLKKQLAAAELSNKQLRDELQYAKACLPDLPLYDPAAERLRKALAQQPSTEALDAYVAEKMPAWQPIETAPKDGTPMLVYSAAGWTGRVSWNKDAGQYMDEHTEFVNVDWLTHWMPLPPSPEQKG